MLHAFSSPCPLSVSFDSPQNWNFSTTKVDFSKHFVGKLTLCVSAKYRIGAPTVQNNAHLTAESAQIPAVLHQMWAGPGVPLQFEDWTASWAMRMPQLQRKFYTDADLPAVVKKYTPQFYEQWSAFHRPVEKADFARYVLLYGEGGVYADLDVELIKPLDDFLGGFAPVVLPLELKCELVPAKHFWNSRGRISRGFLGQSIMLSAKGQRVWLQLMEYLIQHYEKDGYETFNTGPDGVTEFFNSSPDMCKAHGVRAVLGLLAGPYSVHHGTGSWRSPDALLRKRKTMAKHAEFVGLRTIC